MRGETIIAHIPGAVKVPHEREENGQLRREQGTDVEIRGCLLAPHDASESGRFGPVTMTSWHVYAPAAAFLPADTTFTIRGVPGWQLEGEFGEWRSGASGKRKGIEFTAKRGS